MYVGLIILVGHVTSPVRGEVVKTVTVVGGIVMVVGCSTVLITTFVRVVVYSEYSVEREVTTLTDRLVSVMVIV